MSEKSKLMAEIVLLAMKVQEETDHVVFVRFSGHVNGMRINIGQSKGNWMNEIAKSEFYTDENESIERMEEAKETLLEIIKNKKVDFNQMDYEIEKIKNYIF